MARMSRREFGTRLGAAAGAAAGAQAFGQPAYASTARGSSRIIGANGRVVLASIGIRGRGNAIKRNFAKLDNVDIKTLCDIDANLQASRVNDTQLKDLASYRPGFVQDMRRVLEDKDVDAVLIATPNHWHALATMWA